MEQKSLDKGLWPAACSFAKPDRVCNGHGEEATGRSSATAAGGHIWAQVIGCEQPRLGHTRDGEKRGLGAEVRVEATGVLCSITQRSVFFIASVAIKLSLFKPPKIQLQSEDADRFRAVTLAALPPANVKALGSLPSSSHGHGGCAGDRPRSK